MKTLLRKIWNKIKLFVTNNQVIILKIINWVVIGSIYIMNDGNIGIEVVTGLWIFFNVALVLWKWFNKK